MINRSRIAALLAVVALTIPAGCGSDDSDAVAAESSAPVARDLASYDAYVLGSVENNPLFADVYGVRFEPFAVERITTGKRVSSLTADAERVSVAAADQDVDRLALLTGSGELQPVPGLGRPFAYTPILRDGTMYFNDAQGDKTKGEYRYYSWNFAKQRKSLLFQSVDDLGAAQPLGDGRFLVSTGDNPDVTELAVRAQSGKLTKFPIEGNAFEIAPGKQYFAATLVGAGDSFGNKPEALVLIDRKTGKSRTIPGLQQVCWNPDGTRLLARRTDAQGESRLVLLDPAKPDAPVDVATVPGLTIYTGTWVRGDIAP